MSLLVTIGTSSGLPLVVSYDLHVRAQTATFGLAYKLDVGGPVVAKYWSAAKLRN